MKRAAKRALNRHGRDATIRNFERSEGGGRETWSEASNSPQTLTVRVDRSGSYSPDRDQRETGEPETDITVYVQTTDQLVLDSGESHTVPSGETQFYTDTQVADDATLTVNGTLVVGFIDSIRDGGGEGATEIDIDGQTYVVIRKDVQDNGLWALDCERVS